MAISLLNCTYVPILYHRLDSMSPYYFYYGSLAPIFTPSAPHMMTSRHGMMAEPWVSVGNFGRTVKERAARRPAQPARHQHTTGLDKIKSENKLRPNLTDMQISLRASLEMFESEQYPTFCAIQPSSEWIGPMRAAVEKKTSFQNSQQTAEERRAV